MLTLIIPISTRADIVSESQAAFPPIATATQPAAGGCACLSVLYLLLEHLRVKDQLTAPNDFALLRSTIESASEVLTCQKCPLRYFSIVQNAALLGVLCLCVAESYHRIVRSIDEEEKRASEADEKKQLGIHNGADQPNQPTLTAASPLFQIEVSPSQWGSMMRNLASSHDLSSDSGDGIRLHLPQIAHRAIAHSAKHIRQTPKGPPLDSPNTWEMATDYANSPVTTALANELANFLPFQVLFA
ncbi:hypothetical protein CcaCcLH18_13966 [Colletotrichum camelliae]|nr:hypothetical protein CcaCcLH18_13966 [Colletotrichum camelliae]